MGGLRECSEAQSIGSASLPTVILTATQAGEEAVKDIVRLVGLVVAVMRLVLYATGKRTVHGNGPFPHTSTNTAPFSSKLVSKNPLVS